MRIHSTNVVLAGAVTLVVAAACSAACGSSGDSEFGDGTDAGGTSSGLINSDGGPCAPTTCEQLGWACGYTVSCGKVTNCADEGRTCGSGEVCVGGLNGQPTKCVAGSVGTCDVCAAIPACSGAPQKTVLTGRVITPGRDDNETADQVGIPNAIVYIPRSADPSTLPAISTGIPSGAASCDRCDQEDLGPVVAGAVTNAKGEFRIEGNVPVGKEFLLVVRAGKFRRVTKQTLPSTAACQTTGLPTAAAANPARLPRSTTDGLAVNIPKIAISTGQIDAIECVFEKMGIAHTEFGNPGTNGTAAPRLHLYRGGTSAGSPAGAKIDAVRRDARRRRFFASHLSFSWLDGNGTTAYSASTPIATGPLTSQEKVLLYMLFDVSACVGAGSATAPVCTPVTCADAGASCGFTPDGCGNVLDCGPCAAPK